MKKIIEKLKVFFNTNPIGIEIKSATMTFTGLFAGMILAAPAINHLIRTDLPTIQQFKDVWPVVIDTAYRSAWITVLTVTGLFKYRNTPPKDIFMNSDKNATNKEESQ